MGNRVCCPSAFCPPNKVGDAASTRYDRRGRGFSWDEEEEGSMLTSLDDFKSVLSRRSYVEDGDVWHDALMEHDGEQTFEVSKEELEIIKNHLEMNFPNDDPSEYMSDAYLVSVASKPYSKDMTRRRPLEVSFGRQKGRNLIFLFLLDI